MHSDESEGGEQRFEKLQWPGGEIGRKDELKWEEQIAQRRRAEKLAEVIAPCVQGVELIERRPGQRLPRPHHGADDEDGQQRQDNGAPQPV